MMREPEDAAKETGIIDYIISYSQNKRLAQIEYRPSRQIDDYFYGKVLEQQFPPRLVWLIHEYDELVQHVVMTLLEEVEEEIHTYDLRLESSNRRIYNVMLMEHDISFFTQPAGIEEYADRPIIDNSVNPHNGSEG
ncbi:hypothetical protein [Saccharibacillus sp. JS10]|uniref:hypothetical protein n=1 Tax=Saccharibacillus sp. JS10 TaxID=2950552 RepID=UPI00210B806E|nr:hypothetical protein [Saccharibacillus sp. JS10]MCQ4085353.1 hypothetical protein [Saccharibacillus sp. JS10]